MVYVPTALVTVGCETLVPMQVAVTLALGITAPEGSVMVPTIAPVACATTRRGSNEISATKTVRPALESERIIARSFFAGNCARRFQTRRATHCGIRSG